MVTVTKVQHQPQFSRFLLCTSSSTVHLSTPDSLFLVGKSQAFNPTALSRRRKRLALLLCSEAEHATFWWTSFRHKCRVFEAESSRVGRKVRRNVSLIRSRSREGGRLTRARVIARMLVMIRSLPQAWEVRKQRWTFGNSPSSN